VWAFGSLSVIAFLLVLTFAGLATALESDNYPYLTWAASHYAGKTAGKLSDRDYPLTWEAHASQANYDGMRWVAAEYVKAKTCAPHTWHAAEAFLYLREEKE
jgi:hypothetical protein